MRILFLQEEFCIRALKQAAALSARGHEVYGVAFRPPGQFYKLEEEAKRWFKQYAVADIRKKETIRAVCKKWDIELIHSHNWPDTYTVNAIKTNCAPVVHDLHDMESLISADAGKQMSKIDRFAEEFAVQKSNGRIYVTEQMAVLAEKKYGFQPRSVILPCLTSLSFRPQFQLQKLSAADGEIHLVYQGGLIDNRTPMHSYYLYETFKDFLKAGFHVHAYTSNADPQVAGFYKRLGKNFHFEGKVSPQQLAIDLTKYDFGIALFNKALIGENSALSVGFANKFGDYILSGIPPIVDARTPAMYNLAKEYDFGIAAESIEDAILILNDPMLRESAKQSINEDIQNLLSFESCYEEILKLYKDSIANWKSK